jgi:phosphatidylserine/phosphatidylglycerophosphate/cardiolipin synthase-like enzyme
MNSHFAKNNIFFVFFIILNSYLFSSQINIYFTDPDNNPPSLSSISTIKKPIDFALKEFIDSTLPQTTIYICIDEVNDTTITTAVDNAVNRSVKVYAIFDKEDSTESFKSSFRYEIRGGAQLMHNKFVVVKSSKVWTGSYNFTVSATCEQDNFALEIFSSQLAEIYEKAFWYMWEHSNNISISTRIAEFNNKQVSLDNGTKITVYFNPYSQNPQLKDVLINNWYDFYEEKPKIKNLCFAVAWFTEKSLADYLIQMKKQDVSISGIVDDQTSGDPVFTQLRNEGIDIWFDGRQTWSGSGLMHHKFCVLDLFTKNAKVICGSANWSDSALTSGTNKNYENLIVIESQQIAEIFYKEFLRLYNKAVSQQVSNSLSNEMLEDILFYPNPVKEKLNIKFKPNFGVKEIKFMIVSLYGIKIYEKNLEFTAGIENKTEVELPKDISYGLYNAVLRVKSFETQKDYIRKIVIR